MRKLGIVVLVSILIIILVLSGCNAASSTAITSASATSTMTSTTATSTSAAPDSITIGALLSLTGGDASTGQPSKEGYQLGVDMINAQGGVFVKQYNKKIPLKLVTLDMQTNPQKGQDMAQALNSQYHATAVVGTTLINTTAAIFEENKLPAVTILVALNSVFNQGYKYFFTVGHLDSDTAKGFIDVLNSLPQSERPTKIALATEQTEFGTELSGFIKQYAAQDGMQIVYEGQYAMGASDMSQIILGAKNAGAEVLIGEPITPDGISMLKTMQQLGYHPKAIEFNRATDDPSWAGLGDLTNYTMGSPDWLPGINYPGSSDLNDQMQAKFGHSANYCTGPAVASIQVIAAAIEKAGTLNREQVRDAIAATNMMTVIGPMQFQDNGARLNPPDLVEQWQNGKDEIVWPDDLKTSSIVYPIP